MRKIASAFLSVILILATLCSCSVARYITEAKDKFFPSKTETTASDGDRGENLEQKEETEETTSNKKLVKTKYFNLVLPDSFANNCHISMTEGSDYEAETGEFLYTVSFHEKSGYERNGSGHLVDVILTTDYDFSSFARGERIGEMVSDRTYYFFARYPSDVQFDLDNQKIYEKMRDDVDKLLASIFSDEHKITLYDGKEGASVDSDFIFPDSSVRKLTESEISAKLSSMSGYSPGGTYAQDAINEIYARNGYVFKTAEVRSYYEAKSWYVPDSSFSYSDFNEIELYNISLLNNY